MKIYVASSWRNEQQPDVVAQLRADGHDVYDFKDSDGFSWREVDPEWVNWPSDIPKYIKGLDHPAALRGFNRDMGALMEADACVYVMPCGVSASWEAGYAVGAGKPTFVYVPGVREPDLMVKMATMVTDDLEAIREALRPSNSSTVSKSSGPAGEDTAREETCQCKHADARRCAYDGELSTMACVCACHSSAPQTTEEQ